MVPDLAKLIKSIKSQVTGSTWGANDWMGHRGGEPWVRLTFYYLRGRACVECVEHLECVHFISS